MRGSAKIVSAAHQLGAQHGILIAVPVPEKDALPAEKMEDAIRRATAEAEAKNIRGKAVTPFLLARVAELTAGESRRANIALLVNNARTAAEIAVALSGDGP